jgi:serine/threonine protein kinase
MRERFFAALPRYRYERVLGRGGMGVVFAALDRELDTETALKVHFPSNELDREELLARFKRELTLNRKVKHPNVARLHDFGTAAGYPYISMELLPGRSLSDVLDESEKLPPSRMLPIFRQIALGTAAAHAAGIVHRDLKPGNVMVGDDGGVAIVDFGLARSADADSSLTRPGYMYGTPRYMAPEQVRGAKIDGRADVYAIGGMAFQALTGSIPFPRESQLQVALAQLNDAVPAAMLDDAGVSPPLRAIVLRCLEKSADDRYQRTEDLAADLALAAVEAPPPAGPARRPRVLVVDDDEELRALVRTHLARAGCDVAEADSGQAALECVHRGDVDFLLMDVSMPVMDGFDALRVLKSDPSNAALPVMMMSALPERNRLAFALRAGALEFLPKPLDLPALKEKVWTVLEARGFARGGSASATPAPTRR